MIGVRMKKRKRSTPHLRLLFVLAVIIPCLVLGVIAIRSVNREEAFIEMRLQRTIDAELVHMVSLLDADLDRIREELASSLTGNEFSSPQSALPGWKARSGLVGVPFLLSPDLKIVWPSPSETLSEDERAFLNWNREFITGRAPIPVYQNIALLYKDEITKSREDLDKKVQEAPAAAKVAEESPMLGLDRAKPSAPLEEKSGIREPKSQIEEVQVQQKAISDFEKSPDLRRSVYDQARERGQQAAPRTVSPAAALSPEKQAPPQESIFISEPQHFNEITQGRENGLIPRFIQDKLTILFWKRDPSRGFIGCVIDGESLRGRLARLLPNLYTPVRILTILDENGRPLITPDGNENRDWRRPLVAREISEKLPRWEVAAYLSSPDAVASRANLTALILWILVLFLFVAIASGGTYILNTLRSEMLLARQKTTFVANVSHELKTPLTSIRMFAEMLKQRRQPDPEKQEKYLDLMVSETERLTRLINNVLDFARMERGERKYEKKRLDVALLCEGLIEGQRVRLEHNGFEVAFQNDLGEAFIEGDEEALKQALLNLLSNAEKYCGDARRIDVDITGTSESVLINVKDRGIGVSPREAKKIFEEFYRADDSPAAKVRGSGLGLPIALRIVRDHGGDIHYFPRDGGGSVFQIRLPRQKRETQS
jgi:signal transduction histidine kinase